MQFFSNRYEKVYESSDIDYIVSRLGKYKQEIFDKPYSYTVYFGGRSVLWEGKQLLSHAALKVRIYSNTAPQGLFSIKDDDICIFEIKTREDGEKLDDFRSKLRLKTKNGQYDLLVTFGMLKEALCSPRSFKKVFEKSVTPKIVELFTSIWKTYKLTTLEPLAATAYFRRSYFDDYCKITIDQDVGYYLAFCHVEKLLFVRAHRNLMSIIEIKSNVSKDVGHCADFVASLESHSNTRKVSGEETKGAKLWNILNNKLKLKFVEPELELFSDNEWRIIERELKIDLDRDARGVSVGVEEIPGYTSGFSKANLTHKRYYFFEGNRSYCTVQWRMGLFSKIGIKYKKKISGSSDEILVRSEVVKKFNKKNIAEAKSELNIPNNETPVKSPYLRRERVTNFLYSLEHGLVFSVHIDHCKIGKGYSPLNQVEVEFEGGIVYDGSLLESSQEVIDKQLEYIGEEYKKILLARSFGILATRKTKEEWLLEEMKFRNIDNKQ